MAAFELLLSQARRHCSAKPPYHFSALLRSPSPFLHSTLTSQFLGFRRSLCSSSSSSSSPEQSSPTETRSSEPTRRPPPPSIHATSYPVKPKDPSPPQEDPPQSTPLPRRAREPSTVSDRLTNAEGRAWTREDIRYVKDVPKISPVSYPSRVAPLPEDRLAAPEEGAKGDEKKDADEQLERERKRIEADSHRRPRWGFRVEEETVPFPTLIKQQHKKEKVVYDLQEAIRLVKSNAKANFDETVEVHVNLTPELRRTDLKLDGIATLPHGTGKAVKIAVFAEGSAADEARAAGADVVGGVELVEGIKNGSVKVDFDVCITTHQFVQRLQKLGNVLRSRMPSTKAGTVTDDVAKTVREAKRIVKINKKDKAAVVHAGIGKVSFSEEALRENMCAFVNALLLAKPAGLKKSSKYVGYVNAAHICSTSASFFLSSRRLSTSALTPGSSDGAFPPNLLSTKQVITPERKQGLYGDLVIPVTNFHNEDKGYMVLAGDVFDVPIRKDIVHRVVRWQLAKRQQGTHSTKTISEVSGTGRKPWRQKGTGRARHGTLRGPQFRGGATMHGPKPRSHAIKLNKKVRRLGLKIALSARAAEGKLMVFEDLEVPTHKTKNIVNYVNQMEEAKKLLLVDGGPINEKLKLATQNLHYVNVLPSIGLNVYSILLHDTLVMSRDAVNRLVERMHTPINR